MKRMAVMITVLSLISPTCAQDQHTQTERKSERMHTINDITMVSPALEKYAQGPLAELWKRPGLTSRDRSIVTIAALIARNQTIEMPYYFNLALDNGVRPREISEIITHLAFYSGWENTMAAAAIAKDVFADRKIGPDQLPAASPSLLPLDKESEARRATNVEQQFGNVAPGIVQYTTDVLFRDLWLRPDLAPRDRSLVTVSALIASGQVAQITYHLNRAMDNGLTQTQAAEVVTHLAFYAGWKNNPVLPVETRSTTNYKAILVPLNKHGKSSRALLIRCTAFSSSPALLPRCAHRNFSRFAGQTCYGTRTGLR